MLQKYTKYSSYQHYVAHQASKINRNEIFKDVLGKGSVLMEKSLTERLKKYDVVKKGTNVLCLGARLGTEVQVFRNLGAFAVGIDLNPRENNPYVLYGDFHSILFPDQSADIVYSNSVDHTNSLELFISEIKRVLKPDGKLILTICAGTKEGGKFEEYETLQWDTIADIAEKFDEAGFVCLFRSGPMKEWYNQEDIIWKLK